jgi:magnesium transporter
MIRILYRHASGTVLTNLADAEIKRALGERRSALWVDMQAPTQEEFQRVLVDVFGFHPLAVEDVISDVHVPKLDDYGGYLFLVLHTLGLGDERMDIHTYEMDIFLGVNYLVTIHNETRQTIDRMWMPDYHKTGGLARGAAYVLYDILDQQVDGYVPLLEELDERLESLGDYIFETDGRQGRSEALNDLLTAKSSALRMRRILTRQREILYKLSVADFDAVPADMRIYFSDVFDHLVRLDDLADSMRDLASTTIEAHLALVNNRTNDVMKVLTLVGTLFLPLSFLAGVYGMNFEYMPELGWPWAYPLIWVIFIVAIGGMLYWFRQRDWL